MEQITNNYRFESCPDCKCVVPLRKEGKYEGIELNSGLPHTIIINNTEDFSSSRSSEVGELFYKKQSLQIVRWRNGSAEARPKNQADITGSNPVLTAKV